MIDSFKHDHCECWTRLPTKLTFHWNLSESKSLFLNCAQSVHENQTTYILVHDLCCFSYLSPFFLQRWINQVNKMLQDFARTVSLSGFKVKLGLESPCSSMMLLVLNSLQQRSIHERRRPTSSVFFHRFFPLNWTS